MGHCEKRLDTPLPAYIGAVRLSREAKVSLIEATASSFAESFTERTVLEHGVVWTQATLTLDELNMRDTGGWDRPFDIWTMGSFYF